LVAPNLGFGASLKAQAEALLVRHWAMSQPSWLARALQPLSWLYSAIFRWQRQSASQAQALPVPVLVVGNFTVGGGGKTPTVIALVQALQAAGHKPGVISRGHGRDGNAAQPVTAQSTAQEVGDEPLLIQRRTGVPVWVGRDRPASARQLCQQHPEVNVLVSDDGLQHHALRRDAAVAVFDERGAGNGLLLPAGPLREALPSNLGPKVRVLYTAGQVCTRLPGGLAQRRLQQAWPLAAWLLGDASQAVPLPTLRGRPLLAAAGLAAPEKFFSMLEAEGLDIQRLPLPDHFAYRTLPWPGTTPDVITTEKDAVKIAAKPSGELAGARIWVVPLDLQLPAGWVDELIVLLALKPTAKLGGQISNKLGNPPQQPTPPSP
jgi:tetraacyldisaccharide 4'-kinase